MYDFKKQQTNAGARYYLPPPHLGPTGGNNDIEHSSNEKESVPKYKLIR
jgi:hypothetical protein